MKRISIFILILFTGFIYRTQLFDLCVSYEPMKEIPIVELTDEYWTSEVDQIYKGQGYQGVSEYNDLIVRMIAKRLKFGNQQIEKNPNKFRKSTAHCVGYSGLHASILQYTFESDLYKVSHQRGDIYFLGVKLSNMIKSSFFRDHDFIKIENTVSGRFYYSDASLYEFTRISRVGFRYGL